MALDDDITQMNNSTQTDDPDIPVDPDAEATNSEVAAKTNKLKVAGLGIVVGIVVLAGIVVYSLTSKPDAELETAPPRTAQTPATRPAPKPTPAPTPAPTPTQTATPSPNDVITDSGVLTRPATQDWVKGLTQPLPVPNGLEATPGLPGSNIPQISIVRQSIAPAAADNALMPELRRLWEEGARAKHRGDIAGARRAWQRILELSPNHPGIQSALDKLPQ